MAGKMTQDERLAYLTEAFKADAKEYIDLELPKDIPGKQQVLRSLMNIRMPDPMDEEVLRVQDAYLQERAREKGIVKPEEIPMQKDGISIWQGDITRLAVDAIVNAANAQMLGCFQPCHTCIDNCIHTYAGIQLRAECSRQMQQKRIRYGKNYEQPTAVPMLTDAYNLPAKKVIHVVGPIVYGRLTPELEKKLSECYSRTLDLCAENNLKNVAFCCISTGVFRFPNQRAAEIAFNTVENWRQKNPGKVNHVIFNVFKDDDRTYYEELIGRDD